MLHLSPLYRIDPGFNSKDEKMYRFDSFACGFPVLIEFFCLFLGFGCGFAVLRFLISPNTPSLWVMRMTCEKNESKYFHAA